MIGQVNPRHGCQREAGCPYRRGRRLRKTNGAALRRTNTIRITPGRSLEGLSPGNSTSNWESEMKRLESYLFRTFLLAALSAPGFGQALKVEPMANPSGATSLQAHWGTAQDGSP